MTFSATITTEFVDGTSDVAVVIDVERERDFSVGVTMSVSDGVREGGRPLKTAIVRVRVLNNQSNVSLHCRRASADTNSTATLVDRCTIPGASSVVPDATTPSRAIIFTRRSTVTLITDTLPCIGADTLSVCTDCTLCYSEASRSWTFNLTGGASINRETSWCA